MWAGGKTPPPARDFIIYKLMLVRCFLPLFLR